MRVMITLLGKYMKTDKEGGESYFRKQRNEK